RGEQQPSTLHWTAVEGTARQEDWPPTTGRERSNSLTEMVSSRTLAVVCGVDLLHGVSAWLPSPLRVPTSTTGQRWAVRDIVAGEHHDMRQQWSALRSVADGEG
ncbi:unnamed protein product, partial [Ectocarpus sp. 12 AP-2014]